MRHKLEFLPLWGLVRAMGMQPRPLARGLGIALAQLVYLAHPKLRRVGMRNLELAFPEKSRAERKKILRKVFTGMGRQLAEFCLFPKYTKDNIKEIAIHDGFENFDAARQRGKGVLLLTGHFGGWEVGSFAHSVYGFPIKIVVRDLDNPLIDDLVRRYRTLHGNSTFDNREFARSLLSSMRAGDTVGILMDTNMTPPQGVFVDYFGIPACTASGLARVALKTDAAVIPAFTIWDEALKRYRIRFEPALRLIRTGDSEADAIANTALFTQALEKCARRYPEQWLWVHRRWKTRPPGQPALY
ncbi:MAG: lipid biosynthesis acyltransferase [Candidatus Angelobacter sp.]|nr:lipid biosynthesis acyltransferase [Candidatus Angelobacter sp.]